MAEVRRERKKRDNLSPANVLLTRFIISKIPAQSNILLAKNELLNVDI
jgi:hypothetical protein